jgi:hypothetical protein
MGYSLLNAGARVLNGQSCVHEITKVTILLHDIYEATYLFSFLNTVSLAGIMSTKRVNEIEFMYGQNAWLV